MNKKNLIKFNDKIWGYDFTCIKCGCMDSTDGEAPVNAINAMKEKGWQFRVNADILVPLCPECEKKTIISKV